MLLRFPAPTLQRCRRAARSPVLSTPGPCLIRRNVSISEEKPLFFPPSSDVSTCQMSVCAHRRATRWHASVYAFTSKYQKRTCKKPNLEREKLASETVALAGVKVNGRGCTRKDFMSCTNVFHVHGRLDLQEMHSLQCESTKRLCMEMEKKGAEVNGVSIPDVERS